MNTENSRLLSLTFILVLFSSIFFSCSVKNQTTEILWDNWGVPHIYAPTEQEMYYSFGWSQAQSHGDLILKLYGQARGRAVRKTGCSVW